MVSNCLDLSILYFSSCIADKSYDFMAAEKICPASKEIRGRTGQAKLFAQPGTG